MTIPNASSAPAVPTLRYHDYAMLLSCLDANWSRPRPKTGHWGAVKGALGRMTAEAEAYAVAVERNYQKWRTANGETAEAGAEAERIDPALFHVQGWIPFGHPDAMTMLLVDDIDGAQTIIERYQGTTEEVTMAFCPIMEGYRALWQQTQERLRPGVAAPCPLVEAEALFDGRRPEAGAGAGSGAGAQPEPEPSRHTLQEEHPLVFFSRLRLTTLLTLGRALPVQDVVYRAMTQNLARTWALLEEGRAEQVLGPEGPGPLKVCYLDLQEEEEIGVLFFCQNYSVAMSLLAGLKNMTVAELDEADPVMMKEVRQSRLYREVERKLDTGAAGAEAGGGGAAGFAKSLPANHVFRWTRTTAAFAWHLLEEAFLQHQGELKNGGVPAASSGAPAAPAGASATPQGKPAAPGGGAGAGLARVHGRLRVETAVGVMPGHLGAVLELLKHTGPAAQPGGAGYLLHSLGTEDLTLPWHEPAAGGGPRPAALVDTRQVISTCGLLLVKLDALYQEPAGGGPRTEPRHLTEWSSRLSVPVPVILQDGEDLLHPRVPVDHLPGVIHRVLDGIRDKKALPFLDFDLIRNQTRRYGLPMSQRRSVLYLFENFANILTHPHLCDVVLDFVDVVTTFHRALAWGLPEAVAGVMEVPRPGDYTPRLGLQAVEEIASFLDALDDALELRLRRVYPEMPLRDWALDFRSSLHQPLLSAEAVLKCALAILRKDVLGLNDDRERRAEDGGLAYDPRVRECLGVVVHLNFGPGMKGRSLRHLEHDALSPGGKRVRSRLAIFAADFPHLSLIPGFCDFYHEAFHLVFDELISPGPEREDADRSFGQQFDSPADPWANGGHGEAEGSTKLEEEIFVQMLMLLMVFDGDTELLLRDHAWGYSCSVDSAPRRPPRSDERLPGEAGELEEERILTGARKALAANFFPPALAALVVQSALDSPLAGDEALSPACRAARAPLESTFWQSTLSGRVKALVDALDRHKDLFADHGWLFGNGDTAAQETCLRDLRGWMGSWYAQVAPRLEALWNAARAVYAAHVNRVVAEHSRNPAELEMSHEFVYDNLCANYTSPESFLPRLRAERYQELLGHLDTAISGGWAGSTPVAAGGAGAGAGAGQGAGAGAGTSPHPRSQAGYAPVVGMLLADSGKPGDCLDANMMIRRSLQRYLDIFRNGQPGLCHSLPREFDLSSPTPADLPNTGKIDFRQQQQPPPPQNTKYAPVLLDRSSAVQFCCIPSMRRHHLGCQIGILKTAWDVASRNRARRFVTMLRQAEGGEE